MLPNLVLQVSLTILMIFLTILTGFKGRQIYMKENIRLAVIKAIELQIPGGEDFDEDQFKNYLEQSQPSIFEIILEDLLILKG